MYCNCIEGRPALVPRALAKKLFLIILRKRHLLCLCRQIACKSNAVLQILVYHTWLGVRQFIRIHLSQTFSLEFWQFVRNINNKRFFATVTPRTSYVDKLYANPPQGCKYTIRQSECGNLYESIYRRHFSMNLAICPQIYHTSLWVRRFIHTFIAVLKYWWFVGKLSKLSVFGHGFSANVILVDKLYAISTG